MDRKRRTGLFPAAAVYDDPDKTFQPAVFHHGRIKGDHSWVVLILNGEEKRFDPTAELEGKKYKKADYTVERYY